MTDTTIDNTTNTITNSDGLAELVTQCAASKTPIVDYGVAHTGLGFPPPDEHIQLAYRPDLNTTAGGVIEHYDRDMTVRAHAGATMRELRDALKTTRQFLPIDADDDLTLGEVVTHNVYGPMRVAYGSVRDLLLGLHYIDGQGRDIHVGGRTVKNVAGYDVTRFMVGSLGEFGLVHEATIRTYAIPEQATLIDLKLDDPGLFDRVLSQWMLTDAAPAALSMSNEPERWTAHLIYLGRSSACAVQRRSLETLIDQTEGVHLIGSTDGTFDRAQDELSARRVWRRGATTLVKLMVPPALTGAACGEIQTWGESNAPVTIEAMPAHGCIFTGGELSPHGARKLGDLANHICRAHFGQFAWHARPPVIPEAPKIAPFGPLQPDWPMMWRLKKAMDPKRLFNPGRFITTRSHPKENDANN